MTDSDIRNEDRMPEEGEETAVPAPETEETAEALTEETGEETAEEDLQTPEGPEAEEAAPEEEEEAGTGFFRRRKKDKEKEALREKVDALEDRVRRQMAEFENFRKRTEKEKETMFSMGERSVIEKILPTVDNFERGLAAIPEEERGSAFAEGMDKIYRQLLKQLEELGVAPIEAVGTEFNPDFHNAVMQVESEEYEEGVVAQEFLRGYMYHDSVLRHSMVAVAK